MEDSGRGASYTVPCDDYVHVVEFSPFDSGSAALLAYGGNQYVVVGTCRFQEEDMEVEGVEFTTLRVFHHALRVDCLAWSPESRLDKLPQLIRVWDLEGNETTTFRLRSPGVSVCWHPEDAFKLMVAEKKGTIRFYDLVTQQAILSLDCGQSPLMSADWCLSNTIKVGAVTGSDWVIWDITRSSYPQEKRPAHVERAGNFRWSRVNENLFSTTGCPGKISSQLLVHHLGHPQPVMIGSATVGAGLSWHRSLPLCVIGGDRKLSFWMTEM
ncbi:nucleoporin Nup37 isoform X2 [Oncorhynchus kisutch]|uniref:nucleoporin Nup37 isoform X2 n=1 Tax=Oncorhynchus kisutch TaxID=8019 RepID=UPI0012DE37E5|nr:nucleoporin Nup37 isoform X2 [Oncorhynchus kisutch]